MRPAGIKSAVEHLAEAAGDLLGSPGCRVMGSGEHAAVPAAHDNLLI